MYTSQTWTSNKEIRGDLSPLMTKFLTLSSGEHYQLLNFIGFIVAPPDTLKESRFHSSLKRDGHKWVITTVGW